MALIVQKFGGTSVMDVAHIKRVALRVKHEFDLGNQVVVVVSAMAGFTDEMVSLTNSISTLLSTDDHDAVWAAGEQITAGLLALSLKELGFKSQSFCGWQIPIYTDNTCGDANIIKIDTMHLNALINDHCIPIIAGFQGINPNNRISTLGRGGSDTTAVAIASALNANRCDIYTDVDGVYTADPRIVITARKLDQITYDEMVTMSQEGSKVLHHKCVHIARTNKMPLRVLSTFDITPGTDVVFERESKGVVGISHSYNETLISCVIAHDKINTIEHILDNMNIDPSYIQWMPEGDNMRLAFLVAISKIRSFDIAMEQAGLVSLNVHPPIAKISLIGSQLSEYTHSLILKTIDDKQIPLLFINESPFKVSIAVQYEYGELTLRSLHHVFELDRIDE
jgi:aspartate kinase